MDGGGAMTMVESMSSNNILVDVEYLLNQWKTINLPTLRITIDQNATEIGENKEASIKARKTLAKDTQDFGKASEAEKLRLFGVLLKRYQDEIDRLTKRSKFAESSFLTLYKTISEAPDPVPAIAQGLGASSLELENRKLQKEVAEFTRESQELRNQEVTVKRLEESLRDYESRMEELVQERVLQTERKMQAEFARETAAFREREVDNARALSFAQEERSRAQRLYDIAQTQNLDSRVRFEEEISAKQQEIEILSTETERSHAVIASLEKRLSEFENEKNLSILSGSSGLEVSNGRTHELEFQLSQRDIELSRLTETMTELRTALSLEQDGRKKEISQLESKLKDTEQKMKALEQDSINRPSVQDWEAVNKELEVLKIVAYGEDNEKTGLHSIEKLLKDRNKHLEHETMRLKLDLTSATDEIKNFQQKISSLETTINEKKQLIERLEEDVAKGSHYPAPAPPSLNDDISNLIQNSNESIEKESIGAGFPGLMNNSADTNRVSVGPQTSTPNKEERGMFEIVSSQRDRFKNRMLELETTTAQLQRALESAKNEASSLRSDNVRLYEKIRFLQSYGSERGKSGIDLEKSEKEKDQDLENKYGKLYDDAVNPFTRFKEKQKFRRYKELNTAERLILTSSKFFLSNKFSRLFLFFYSIFLHILVMGTLYKMAYDDTSTSCSSITPQQLLQQ